MTSTFAPSSSCPTLPAGDNAGVSGASPTLGRATQRRSLSRWRHLLQRFWGAGAPKLSEQVLDQTGVASFHR